MKIILIIEKNTVSKCGFYTLLFQQLVHYIPVLGKAINKLNTTGLNAYDPCLPSLILPFLTKKNVNIEKTYIVSYASFVLET